MQKLLDNLYKIKNKRLGVIPYITVGDPNLDITYKLILSFEKLGLDGVELGIPFSDPLADGIVIQESHKKALKNNITLKKVFSLVNNLKKEKIEIPIILMLYYNLVFNYGLEAFIKDSKLSGVEGIIIPDLPPEEASIIKNYADRERLAMIFLVAPTSKKERIKLINDYTTGFIYYVSVTGTTGAREVLPKSLKEEVLKVKQLTQKPVYVGFGVSKKEHLEFISTFADGVIIGSAIIKVIHESKVTTEIVDNVNKFLSNLIK
jgi:tryptophan synthase alpha chain